MIGVSAVSVKLFFILNVSQMVSGKGMKRRSMKKGTIKKDPSYSMISKLNIISFTDRK